VWTHEPEYCYCEFCYANLETEECNPACPSRKVWMSVVASSATTTGDNNASDSLSDSEETLRDSKGSLEGKYDNRLDVSLPPERGT